MKNLTVKAGMKIGATLGTLLFAIVGLLPGFYFGGYGAISLLAKITGGAVEPSLFSRIFVVCGMLVGIFSMLTVSLVVGGLLGSLFGYLVSLPVTLVNSKENTN